MSFRKYQPEQRKKKKYNNSVHVKRGYYTFSKYYPAGDTNGVYRKSISRANREKRMRITGIVLLCAAVVAVFLLLILL